MLVFTRMQRMHSGHSRPDRQSAQVHKCTKIWNKFRCRHQMIPIFITVYVGLICDVYLLVGNRKCTCTAYTNWYGLQCTDTKSCLQALLQANHKKKSCHWSTFSIRNWESEQSCACKVRFPKLPEGKCRISVSPHQRTEKIWSFLRRWRTCRHDTGTGEHIIIPSIHAHAWLHLFRELYGPSD